MTLYDVIKTAVPKLEAEYNIHTQGVRYAKETINFIKST